MLRYRIEFRAAAERGLRAFPKQVGVQLASAIDGLSVNPRPFGVKKLRGGQNLYRIKAGPGKAYRIVYEIRDDVLLVLVVTVGHRKDVYR